MFFPRSGRFFSSTKRIKQEGRTIGEKEKEERQILSDSCNFTIIAAKLHGTVARP